jgi:hypothetical protein
MLEIILEQLSEQSVPFIIFLAFTAGMVGASMKLIFEVILADRYRQEREAERILNRYRNPLVRAADALRGRVYNVLLTSEESWLRTSDYYRMSTFYVFCVYFAWVEILFNNLLRLNFMTSRSNQRLTLILGAVDKTFNNNEYFYRRRKASDDTGELPKYICKALGEVTIQRNEKGEETCLSFTEFCARYRNDKVFRGWVDNLGPFLEAPRKEYGNPSWDRFHLIELALAALVNYLDPKHKQTREITPAITRRILDGAYSPMAREIFTADVTKFQLPLILEGRRDRRRRWWLQRRGERPILRRPTRIDDIDPERLHLTVSGAELDLASKDGRRAAYRRVCDWAKELTDEVEVGVDLRVTVDATGSPPSDTLPSATGVAAAIADMSHNRVRQENVTVVGLGGGRDVAVP